MLTLLNASPLQLSDIVDFLALFLELATIVFAICEYRKYRTDVRKLKTKALYEQVRSYYIEEDLMAKEILNLRGKAKGSPTKPVLTEFRNQAKDDPRNDSNTRPTAPSNFT